MNKRDQELLEQAGVGDNWNKADWYSMSPKMIEKFADLIRADEREACAKVCEQTDEEFEGPDQWDWHSKDYAKAIRARGAND